MNYLNELNEKQREAVLCTEGPLLVVAGAGSGKTATMTRRIAYLISEKGVDPYNILAVTFTNKAANEMRERIESIADRTNGMWVLTFHAACLRVLRKHIDKLGYGLDFTIYDTADHKTVIRECINDLGVTEKEYPIPYVQSIISSCKNKGVSAKEFKDNCDGFKDHITADLFMRYTEKLKKNNALDFDDLLVKTVELFDEHPEVLEFYADRFKYIMVDEYQDTNEIQYKIVHHLAGKHKNICVVGDEDQCIYQWRGASIRNILEFEQDFPGAKIIKLEQNYRSHGNILGGANSVIKNNTERKGKELWTDKEEGEKIRVHRAYTDKEEAFYITREIHKLLDKGYKSSDIAVLYRTHSQSRNFEEAFSKQDVLYRVIGGTRFYDRKEIKDIVSYMRLIHNNKDNLAFKRVINEPKRGVGDKSIEKIEMLAQVNGTSMMGALTDEGGIQILSAKSADSVVGFIKMIIKYSEQKDKEKISVIYDGILKDSGYMETLEAQNTIEAKSRIENLMEFKSVIYDFEDQQPDGTFEEFLEKIALLTDVDNHDNSEDAVSLMTLHSAKGLEFPVVFLPGMEEGTFPGRKVYESNEALEEERRLCYVGMTRAKDILYMVGASERVVFGRNEIKEESRFLHEIDPQYVEIQDFENRNVGFSGEKKHTDRINPRDQLRYLKQQQSAITKGSDGQNKDACQAQPAFSGGERVKHAKYGEGMVVGMKKDGQSDMITIIFDEAGTKVFDANIVKLKRI
ncbi:MAG: UvrD-helicase domain-containing protein [Firmicutes bacterium]|nr:UvrD-helicase domain-containing protein [Bacillota bacterium]